MCSTDQAFMENGDHLISPKKPEFSKCKNVCCFASMTLFLTFLTSRNVHFLLILVATVDKRKPCSGSESYNQTTEQIISPGCTTRQ